MADLFEKLLDFLEKHYKHIEKKEVKEKVFSDNDNLYIEVVGECRDLGYIKGAAKGDINTEAGIKITGKGRLFLKKLKVAKIQQKHSWVMVIATIFIAIATVANVLVYYWSQINMEAYLIPRNPQLRVWLDTGNNFGQYYFTDNRSLTYIPICFINEGRGTSGHIYVNWNNSWLASGGVNIANIEGGNGTCDKIVIRANECYLNEPECDRKIVPLGKQKLVLNIGCRYCKPQKYMELFDICIWQNSSKECEGYNV